MFEDTNSFCIPLNISNSTLYPPTQPAIGVIGNIGFPFSRNKEELMIPPFTKDEFTRSRQLPSGYQ